MTVAQLSKKSNSWVSRQRPQLLPDLRLICFPYAGGGSSVYRNWGNLLSANVEVCAIQLPGREHRLAEEACRRMEQIIVPLADALEPLLNVPFALFGYSLGALIAFETAHRLRDLTGRSPVHFFAAARSAPQLPWKKEKTSLLSDEAFKKKLLELNGTLPEVLNNTELFELILPTLRADFELNEAYLPEIDRVSLDCPMTVFGGHLDAEVTEAQLSPWSEMTTGSFRLKMFAGDHFFLRSQTVDLLAEISQALSATRA